MPSITPSGLSAADRRAAPLIPAAHRSDKSPARRALVSFNSRLSSYSEFSPQHPRGWQALRRLPFLFWVTFSSESWMYNRTMNRFLQLCFCAAAALLALVPANAQAPAKAAGTAPSPQNQQRAMSLAESGHCSEALPLLKKSIHQVTDRDLKKRIGLLGLNCAMTHNAPYDSLDFLAVLNREFPRDPDVLYAAAHAFSDLSLHASQDLVREAPFSYQVHELNAEALETQGRWQEAAAEYQRIIDLDPTLRGIHGRLGRVLLSS